MNKFHLEYQNDTGIRMQREVNLIKYHSDFHNLYDYIQWLETKIDEKNKDQNSKPDYD